MLGYSRYSPSDQPSISGLPYSFLLGSDCVDVTLRGFKTYSYVYSPTLVSLMRRTIHIGNENVDFRFDEFGGGFFYERLSNIAYPMDAIRDWSLDSV